MKTNSNRKAVIVGIFILLGIAIMITAILTLGSANKTFEKTVEIKVVFNDVNGLQKGNNVWFSGVKIGTIKKITLLPNEQVEVDMNIEVKSKQFIRSDAKAKISSDGLIGNKIVVIYGGTSQAPEIEKGTVLATEKLTNTEEMIDKLAKSNDNLLEITTSFKAISQKLASGEGSIGKLLTDETLINQLNSTATALKRSSMNIENVSQNASAFTAKLNSEGSLSNNLVTDTVIFSRLRSTMVNLQTASKNAEAVVENLKMSGKQLENGLNNKNAPIGMLLHDERSAANLKSILVNLEGGSKKLDENLEALQHNFLLRGFFKKKAKAEEKAVKDSIKAIN